MEGDFNVSYNTLSIRGKLPHVILKVRNEKAGCHIQILRREAKRNGRKITIAIFIKFKFEKSQTQKIQDNE